MKYPLHYLDEDYQVFKDEKITHKNSQGKDSIKVSNTYEHKYIVDAWGDLKLPTGVFFSLRVKRSFTITESYYVFDKYRWKKYSQKTYPNITYEWWTNNSKAKHHITYFVNISA